MSFRLYLRSWATWVKSQELFEQLFDSLTSVLSVSLLPDKGKSFFAARQFEIQ